MAESQRPIDKEPHPRPNYALRRLGAGAAAVLTMLTGGATANAITHVETVSSKDVMLPSAPKGNDIMAGHTPYTVIEEVVCAAAREVVAQRDADGDRVIPPGISTDELVSSCSRIALNLAGLNGQRIKVGVEKNFFSAYTLFAREQDPREG